MLDSKNNPERAGGALELADLFLDLGELLSLLPGTIQAADWLDAYLLCAAAGQVVEDRLAGSRWPGGRAWWRRVGRELERGERTQLAGAIVGRGVRIADRILELSPGAHRLSGLHRQVGVLAGRLAEAVFDAGGAAAAGYARPGSWVLDGSYLARRARAAADNAKGLPAAVRQQPLRLPSSFRSFDQHPFDVAELVKRFSTGWPNLSTPLVVVGVRTSGSYLAPLAAAALRREGYEWVQSITMRPHTTPGREERLHLERAAANGHLVLVLDDPPVSGHSIRAVTDHLERQGVAADHIVPLLALQTATGEVPEPLARYPSVVLRWDEWHVHELLEPANIAATLATMLPSGMDIAEVRPCGVTGSSVRKHVRALFNVDVDDRVSQSKRSLDIAVEGSGLGFFGRHALPVARALGDAVPQVYGFQDGLIYREWVHGPTARQSLSEPAVCAQIADYTARRHQALAVSRDRSRGMAGDQPVWEVASAALSPSLGRAALPLRPFVVDPVVRRLLTVSRPSVVDGRMEGSSWQRPEQTRLVKVDFSSGAFSNLDLSCYDPVFDLAGAAVQMESEPGGLGALAALRQRFEHATHLAVDEERWLLYQLVHLWNDRRRGRRAPDEVEAASSRAVQRYFSGVYLADVPAVADGPLCAIDLDGVLETSPLGFSATSPAGALALRALRAHGYRAVLATGRSLGEVIDRCRSLDLAGGVAEYGSVVYEKATGSVVELLSEEAAQALSRVKTSLTGRDDLEVDDRFRYIARVRSVSRPGSRSVPARLLESLPAPPSGAWQLIVGEGQTDVVLPGIDKARGLSVLADRMAELSQRPVPLLALAVGDTQADASMLRLAQLGYAPANATRGLRRQGVKVVRHAYQRGLAEAVGRLIGHQPGRCPICALPQPSDERKLLLRLLSVQEAGGAGIPLRAFQLAWSALPRKVAPCAF